MFVLGLYIDNFFPCGLMLFPYGLLGLVYVSNLFVLDFIISLLFKIRESERLQITYSLLKVTSPLMCVTLKISQYPHGILKNLTTFRVVT